MTNAKIFYLQYRLPEVSELLVYSIGNKVYISWRPSENLLSIYIRTKEKVNNVTSARQEAIHAQHWQHLLLR